MYPSSRTPLSLGRLVGTAILAFAGASILTAPRLLAQATGTVTVLHNFNGTDGSGPEQGPIKASDGNFYGVVVGGGSGNNGTIYKLTPGGQFSVLHTFQSQAEGTLPKAIIQGRDGNLYGITRGGGANPRTVAGGGTFFRLGLDGTFTKLFDFDRGDPAAPIFPSAIAQGTDGNFYGLSRDGGGLNEGTFFRLSADGSTITNLVDFRGGPGVGYKPEAQFLVGRDGNFYGITTASGGDNSSSGSGTIFRATQGGTVTLVHGFSDSDGTKVNGGVYPLIQGSDGNFYGTSQTGGDRDFGSVYRCTPDGAITVLHNFEDPDVDGVSPGGIVQGSDGNFYGSTLQGFPANSGSLDFGKGSYFQVTPGGTFTTLAKTSGDNNGPANPQGSLVETGNLVFAGVTGVGGPSQDGTVIKLTVTGSSAPQHHPFFRGEQNLGNGVYYLTLPNGTPFGYYAYLSDPHYIFSYDLGYEYVFDTTDGQNGVYLYDFASGSFFYTSPGFSFPYLYDFSLGTTLYYFPDTNAQAPHVYTSSPRYFDNLSTGEIISK